MAEPAGQGAAGPSGHLQPRTLAPTESHFHEPVTCTPTFPPPGLAFLVLRHTENWPCTCIRASARQPCAGRGLGGALAQSRKKAVQLDSLGPAHGGLGSHRCSQAAQD